MKVSVIIPECNEEARTVTITAHEPMIFGLEHELQRIGEYLDGIIDNPKEYGTFETDFPILHAIFMELPGA